MKITPLVHVYAEISIMFTFWSKKVSISCKLSSKFQNLTRKINFGKTQNKAKQAKNNDVLNFFLYLGKKEANKAKIGPFLSIL